MLFTFMTEMFLTTVVGADWMMRSSAEEYAYAENAEEWALVEMQAEQKFEDGDAEKLHGDLVAARMAMLEVTDLRMLASDATKEAVQSWTAVLDEQQPPPPPQFTLRSPGQQYY